MFEDFLADGNLLSVLLMVYAIGVFTVATRMNHADPYGIHSPRFLKHPLTNIVMLLATPCVFWPAVYVGLYAGWVAGIVAWFGLHLSAAIGLGFLGVRGVLFPFHFFVACLAFPVGYYLSFTHMP